MTELQNMAARLATRPNSPNAPVAAAVLDALARVEQVEIDRARLALEVLGADRHGWPLQFLQLDDREQLLAQVRATLNLDPDRSTP